uniref:Caspase domain-containing protein n=1 Tax=Candidatus Kentrum sp. FW TaxID=2126338 RepID=A0A450T6P5_9GAMM|nr:MAG: Caspase domain-containing protein [Candidatus Kentron sp. FW]
MRTTTIISILFLLAMGPMASFHLQASSEDGGTKGVGLADTGEKTELFRYKGSYALLIGVSDYDQGSGWGDLEQIPGELDKVQKMLEEQKFEVTRVENPNSKELETAFDDFVKKHGLDKRNRLLFFFSGHGYTRSNGKGYLVPRDAPDPNRDDQGFTRKALWMEKIRTWAKEIEAHHALFLFDSCFSGAILKTRGRGEGVPPHITRLMAKPVRQFMTAGSADEEVPAKSIFTPAFADAIRDGKGDLNGDGYITGKELGVHLESEVSKFTKQTPQIGNIKDYDLAQGDFVFVSGMAVEKGHEPDRVYETQTTKGSGGPGANGGIGWRIFIGALGIVAILIVIIAWIKRSSITSKSEKSELAPNGNTEALRREKTEKEAQWETLQKEIFGMKRDLAELKQTDERAFELKQRIREKEDQQKALEAELEDLERKL